MTAARSIGAARLWPWLLAIAACGGAQHAAGSGRPLYLRVPAVDGGTVDVASARGRVVVIHVVTTWSLAAVADLEQVRAVRERDGDRVAVFAIALDPDGATLVRPWRDSMHIDYPVGLATDEVRAGASGLGRIATVPTTLVLDTRGAIWFRHEGQLPPGALATAVDDARHGR